MNEPIDAKRYLIVNADDFGQSEGVNRGIITAHEGGIVTSASLMVRWEAAAAAAKYSRAHPELSIGLHVDLGEWAFRGGHWMTLYEVINPDDHMQIEQEVRRQLEMFRNQIGRDPTHLDSHQHVHRSEPLRSIMLKLASELDVPLRGFDSRVQYEGGFYGQDGKGTPQRELITVESLLDLLDALPVGVTEVGCHPGLGHDVDSMYQQERAGEVSTLCDSRVRQEIDLKGIELVSFAKF